ncbi:glutamate carboxypeptidase Tre2 [Xylona heveae TC161]|uniref:Glutamate carboxypeptidase Tre2 n=1 Tax=Xylona heveae (strain CBS 132557 / TC161) TaxID=1328760 RepID=A0A165A0K6_XYLHT|nr:glutamate carboxypeptidase Tre2 [Xylona heveae TC161]KZF19781.1 glutamate carboxypeptidase Tre2 [Xylona heveae TC161]
MSDKKTADVDYAHLPIPTYEEATSSRPTSSQSYHQGTQEINDNAEREGLLGQSGRAGERGESRHGGYRPPMVGSERSSIDSEFSFESLERDNRNAEDEELRREMFEMEVLDAESGQASSQTSPMRHRFSKRLNSITNTLSSIHLPFRMRMPSFSFDIWSRMPPWMVEYSVRVRVLARFLGLILVMLVVYALFVTEIFPFRNAAMGGQMYDPESVRSFVQGNVDEHQIRKYLSNLTGYDRMAGTEGSYASALYVEELFRAGNLEGVGLDRYQVYLNFPRKDGRRVAIIEPPELAWEAVIEEESVYEHPTPQQQQTMVFHGHSRAGNVTGPLVYANYGSREDFETLKENGVDLKGTIVLVRYYGTQGDRALKVRAAELAGAAGCIIYSDPAEDGFRKGAAWPDGRWRPSDGVQRGAVSLMSWVVGDVLTPGYGSLPDADRISKNNNPGLVNIPSIPLAWRDAQKLLQVLKGHGHKVTDDWVGGVPDIKEWWSGDQSSPIIHLMNEQDEIDKQPIYNVVGKITGLEQPSKTVYVGNHRDSWCFGATDPGSGTAVMLEVIRIFGELRDLGWRPMRSIVFNSWDAEEYNLIGSTEFVESNLEYLHRDGIAYLNVDVAVAGSDFEAAGSPVFRKSLGHVLDRTSDPFKNKTLRAIWEETGRDLGGLGAGSDYVAFQDIAGTSSIDIRFSGPGFPYHSCYDSFEWMDKFGDPGFQYHKILAQVWALLILEIADTPVLPFDMFGYAVAVGKYIEDVQVYAYSNMGGGLNFAPLREAAEVMAKNTETFEAWEMAWVQEVYGSGGFESNVIAIQRMSRNTRMAQFETDLLDLLPGGGLPGREQFKHVIFAPQAWSGYDEAFFPGIRDAVDARDWPLAQKQIQKAADLIRSASEKLIL